MEAIAIIPARGGSKGLPRKNIRMVGGKPLVQWTIEAAQNCAVVKRIIVSSDDEETLSIAASCGAEALRRPIELAEDTSAPELVFEHALRSISDSKNLPEFAVYLQPTSPLRSAVHLSEAFAAVEECHADALISVCEADKKILKAFVCDSDGHLRGVLDNEAPFRNRQILPRVYVPNGAVYIVRSKDFIEKKTYLPSNTIPYIMPAELSIDVDSEEDIALVETFLDASSK